MSDTVTLQEQHQAAERLIKAYYAALEEQEQVYKLENRKRELEAELKAYAGRQASQLNSQQNPFSILYKGWLFLFYQSGTVEVVKPAGSAPTSTTDLPLFDSYLQVVQDLKPYKEPVPNPAEKAYKEAISHYLTVVQDRAFIHENYLILRNGSVIVRHLDLKI